MPNHDVFPTIATDELATCTGGIDAIANSPTAQAALARNSFGVSSNSAANLERSGNSPSSPGNGGGGGYPILQPVN